VRSRPFPTLAAGVLLLAVVVVFFPTLFFGRVASPLDVVFNDPPWRAGHHPVEVANPALRRPATTFLPAAAQLQREGPSSAVWSPYAACGGAGTLEWSRGLLSPFVLPFLPWVGWAYLCNVLILGKLACAFAGVYLLLRRLGRSRVGAATGAAVYALSGPLAARWLWPVSGAGAVLPLLLWAVDRALAEQRLARKVATVAPAWLALLACGSPPATLVAGLAVAVWTGYRLLSFPSTAGGPSPGHSPAAGCRRREVRAHLRSVLAVGAGLVVALAILAPALGLFAISPDDGASPELVSPERGWGWSVLRLLVDPFAFGDPRLDSFEPPAAVGPVGFHDSCVAIGIVAAALALLGTAARRPPWRPLGVAAAVLCVLAWEPATRVMRSLPWLGDDVWALAPLSALALAALAALGVDRLGALAGDPRRVALLICLPVAVVLEQGFAAGHLLAYLPYDESGWSSTPALLHLQERGIGEPSRIAPLQDVLWPDTAAAYGLEDLRSNLGAGDAYRRWLQAVDPQVWGHFGRSLRLNAATVDLGHPYLAALGARWVLEPSQLRLVEYVLGQKTVEVEPRSHLLGPLSPDDPVVQELDLPPGCRRLAVHATARGRPVEGHLEARVVDEVTGDQIAACRLSGRRLATEGSAWVDLPVAPAAGRRHRLELTSSLTAGRLWLRTTTSPASIDGRLIWKGRARPRDLGLSFDLSGYSLAYEAEDLRVWENGRAAPRFWPIRSVVAGSLSDLLELDPPLDLRRRALVPDRLAPQIARTLRPPPPGRPESLVLESWTPTTWILSLELAAPALLVSSVRAEPRLWHALLDGEKQEIVPVNGLFVGVLVPEGRHRLQLRASLPSLWYGCSLMGALGLLALTFTGRRRDSAARPQVGCAPHQEPDR